MGKIQDTADNFVDRIIDHQENHQEPKPHQLEISDETAVLDASPETKVHDASIPEEDSKEKGTPKTSDEEHTHAIQQSTLIPPKPSSPPHVLKENPHQNYIYGVGSAIAAVLSLFLLPLTLRITPATILFGILAVLYSRRSERFDGWNASIPKFLGWASMLTGIAVFIFSFFVLFVIYIVKTT